MDALGICFYNHFMRIEILVGLENPVFYPINKSKIIIGSDLSCDIVVSEDQISRKHLIITKEQENYFVIDQGSTNGSYLNEERLIPGRRVEFTSYFPVRLGSSVLVSLVSDEEAEDSVNSLSIPFPGESSAPKKNPVPQQPKPSREPEEKTTVISLRDLQKSNTGTMVKRREAYKKKVAERAKEESSSKKKKKIGKKKKKSFLQSYEIVALLIVGGALYFTFVGDDTPDQVVNTNIETVENAPQVAGPEKPKVPGFLELFELKKAEKCESEVEKVLCQALKIPEGDKWGALEKDSLLIALVPIDSIMKEVRSKLPQGETSKEEYEKELWEIAIGLFWLRGFTGNSFSQLGSRWIVFAFGTSNQGIYLIEASVAIQADRLAQLRGYVDEKIFSNIPVTRSGMMSFSKDFYSIAH